MKKLVLVILIILLFVAVQGIAQVQTSRNCYIEIDSEQLNEFVPIEWKHSTCDDGSRLTLRDYSMGYYEVDGMALIFVGHYRCGKTLRLLPTSKNEIALWEQYFNTKAIFDYEEIRNSYMPTDIW